MIVWSLTGLKNPQRSLWVYLQRYIIAEVDYHTLVRVKNNTWQSRTVFSPVSSCFGISAVRINKLEVFLDTHSCKPSALLTFFFFFFFFFFKFVCFCLFNHTATYYLQTIGHIRFCALFYTSRPCNSLLTAVRVQVKGLRVIFDTISIKVRWEQWCRWNCDLRVINARKQAFSVVPKASPCRWKSCVHMRSTSLWGVASKWLVATG